jgi:hypothetical protein
MESAVVLQRTASVVAQTPLQAEPTESAAVQTTTVMNTRVHSVLATERIQAWRLTETAAAVLLVKVVPQGQ